MYIRQPGLSFKKCYERDQNMRAGGRESGAKGWGLYNKAGGRGLDKSNGRVCLHILY